MKFSSTVWDNSVHNWCIAALVTLCLFAVTAAARRVSIRLMTPMEGTSTSVFRDAALHLTRRISIWLLLAISLTVGTSFLHMHHIVRTIIYVFLKLAIFLQIGLFAQLAITLMVKRVSGQSHDRVSGTALTGFAVLGKVALWAVLVLVAMENLGVHITTLIAGLGIGGIAIGLAMQGILADLISSMAIVLDRPFAQGDSVTLSVTSTGLSGTVERIGLRSTRIRAVSGEEVIVPNATLISATIQNFQSLQERRSVVEVGVTYDTPAEKLEKIPGMTQKILDDTPDLRFNRANFSALGASAFNFEIVYYVTTADYMVFMERQQTFLLALVRAFNEAGISFAFPTQTVYLEQS